MYLCILIDLHAEALAAVEEERWVYTRCVVNISPTTLLLDLSALSYISYCISDLTTLLNSYTPTSTRLASAITQSSLPSHGSSEGPVMYGWEELEVSIGCLSIDLVAGRPLFREQIGFVSLRCAGVSVGHTLLNDDSLKATDRSTLVGLDAVNVLVEGDDDGAEFIDEMLYYDSQAGPAALNQATRSETYIISLQDTSLFVPPNLLDPSLSIPPTDTLDTDPTNSGNNKESSGNTGVVRPCLFIPPFRIEYTVSQNTTNSKLKAAALASSSSALSNDAKKGHNSESSDYVDWLTQLDQLTMPEIISHMKGYNSDHLYGALTACDISIPSVDITLRSRDLVQLNMLTAILAHSTDRTAYTSSLYPYQPNAICPSYTTLTTRSYSIHKSTQKLALGGVSVTYLPESTASLPYPPLLVLPGLSVETIEIAGVSFTAVGMIGDVHITHQSSKGSSSSSNVPVYRPYDIKLIPPVADNNMFISISYNTSIVDLPLSTPLTDTTNSIPNAITNTGASVMLGYHTTRTHISLSSVSLHIDTSSFKPLYEILGVISSMKLNVYNHCIHYMPTGHHCISTYRLPESQQVLDMYTHGCIPILHCPDSSFLLTCDNLNIRIDDANTTILNIYSYNNIYTTTTYGTHLSQIAGSVSSIVIHELSQPLALHTKIISNFELDSSVKNHIDFHMSTRRGCNGLLEIIGENVRVIYLQRTLVTLISYIRDHFITAIWADIRAGEGKWGEYSVLYPFSVYISGGEDMPVVQPGPQSMTAGVDGGVSDAHDDNTNDTNGEDVVEVGGGVEEEVGAGGVEEEVDSSDIEFNKLLTRLRQSQFRFSVTIKNFEGHFPVSSYGADSLVLLSKTVTVYMGRRDDEDERRYCKGPYLTEHIWMSDLELVHAWIAPQVSYTSIMALVKKQGKSVQPTKVAPIEWVLPAHTTALMAPESLSDYDGVKVVSIAEETTICNWCSQNPIGSNMHITILVTVEKAIPTTRDILDTYESEETDYIFGQDPAVYAPGPCNTFLLGIDIDGIDWTVTQGQYQTIANMITLSFGEFANHVKEMYPAPSLSYVPGIVDSIYGKYCPEHVASALAALATSVPVNFRRY